MPVSEPTECNERLYICHPWTCLVSRPLLSLTSVITTYHRPYIIRSLCQMVMILGVHWALWRSEWSYLCSCLDHSLSRLTTIIYYFQMIRGNWKAWQVISDLFCVCGTQSSRRNIDRTHMVNNLSAYILPVSFLIFRHLRFLELGHTISILHAFYFLTVLQFGNLESLFYLPQSAQAAIFFSGFIGSVVQVRSHIYLPIFVTTTFMLHLRHFSQPVCSEYRLRKSSP